MPTLSLTVDALDGLDDAIKPLYVERDGKYHLDVQGLEDTSGLKSALDKERKAARDAAAQSAAWKALGKSPEEIKELLETQAKADEDKAAKAGEWDKLRAQIVSKHDADLKAEQEKTGKMRSALERHLIDAAAVTEIARAEGVPELLLPHVQRQMRVIETDDGEFIAQVVDGKGDLRVDGKGEPMALAALIEEMKKSAIFRPAFKVSGTGSETESRTKGGPGKTISSAEFNALSPKDRAKKMDEGFVLAD